MPKHSVFDLEGIFWGLNVLDNESSSKFTTNRHQSNSHKPRFHMTAGLEAHIFNPPTKKSCLSWWKRWRSGREPSARRVVLVTWPGTWLGTRELRRTKPTTSAQDSGADQRLRSKFQAFNIIAGLKGLRERGELGTERRICCRFTKLKIHNLSFSTPNPMERPLIYFKQRNAIFTSTRHRRMQKIFCVE